LPRQRDRAEFNYEVAMKHEAIARLVLDPTRSPIWAESPGFPAFVEVSRTFVESYSSLVSAGLPPDAIAQAMMGATVNFYEMFGMSADLPEVLRAVADEIESVAVSERFRLS
jgi:hypothetical protein